MPASNEARRRFAEADVSAFNHIRVFVAGLFVVGGLLAVGNAAVAQNQQDDSAPLSGLTADMQRRVTELQNAVRTDPDDKAAHLQLAQIYIDVGDFRDAVTQARAAKRLGGPQDDADESLAWALFASDRSAELFREIKPGDRQPHSEATVRMSLGLAHMNLGELGAAEPLLQDAVRFDPTFLRPHLALASYLLRTGQVNAAREQVDAARALGPDEIGVIRFTGEVYRAEGDAARAVAEFTKILEREPDNTPALLDRSDALISEDNLDEAQRDVTVLVKQGEGGPALFLGALILARQGKFSEADAVLTRLGLGHTPRGYYLAGVVKFRLGQYEQARDDLEKAAAKDSGVAGPVRLRAEIALQRNDPTSAIRVLTSFINANPHPDEGITTVLARAYVANGQLDKVLALYQPVAQPQPAAGGVQNASVTRTAQSSQSNAIPEIDKIPVGTQDAKTAALQSELRNGRVDRISGQIEALAQSAPDDPSAQNLFGLLRLAQGRLPEAETIFRNISTKTPTFTEATYHLVDVLMREGKQDEANSTLKSLVHG